jgi:hypothetical protein
MACFPLEAWQFPLEKLQFQREKVPVNSKSAGYEKARPEFLPAAPVFVSSV